MKLSYENSIKSYPKQNYQPVRSNDLDKICEPEGEEMTRVSRQITPQDQPKTQEAMIEKNIREDTPNIMVSNEASLDQPPSKGSFMNVNE